MYNFNYFCSSHTPFTEANPRCISAALSASSQRGYDVIEPPTRCYGDNISSTDNRREGRGAGRWGRL